MLKDLEYLDEILEEAILKSASDIHLIAGSKPRFRIYGDLQDTDYKVLSSRRMEEMVEHDLGLDVKAVNNAVVGSYDGSYQLNRGYRLPNGHRISVDGRFRISVFLTRNGWSVVLRLLHSEIPDISTLGLPFSIFNLYRKRRGLILVTGATGSGKSTTLASFVNLINQNMYKNIITLENPIEYIHEHQRSNVCQREIGKDCATFQDGLRAALREDPDVILIGEMRDLETTNIALTAAETGHLVCSTLHTIDAADTVTRIIDMYPERQQAQIRSMLTSVLVAVVSQQLLPRKDGRGRVVACECLLSNPTVKNMIHDNKIYELSEYLKTDQAKAEGMLDMDSSIVRLYKEGKISRETALDFAYDNKEVAKLLD